MRFLASALLLAFPFLLSANVTYYCNQLRSGRADQTVFGKTWATAAQGGLGGLLNNPKLFPELSSMRHANYENGILYWDSNYASASLAPQSYTVYHQLSLDISVPETHTNLLENTLSNLSLDERACINGIICSTDDNEPVVTLSYTRPGTLVGSGVATFDSSGKRVISYADSTGFVPGYEPLVDGTMRQVWYDTSQVTSGKALVLDSLSGVQSSSLSYDSETGLYSFNTSDYSPVLSSIQSDLHRIAIDGVKFDTPIVVNPEVTVTPEISVTPDITVNPEIIVNPQISFPSDLEVQLSDDGYQDIVDIIDESQLADSVRDINNVLTATSNLPDLDLSPSSFSEEEQSLLDVPQQWNTQIPLIGNAANVAFGAFLGNIPDPGRELIPMNLSLLGFNITIDFSPFSTYITWFRAFVLMAEFIWFVDCIWRSVVKALSV